LVISPALTTSDDTVKPADTFYCVEDDCSTGISSELVQPS